MIRVAVYTQNKYFKGIWAKVVSFQADYDDYEKDLVQLVPKNPGDSEFVAGDIVSKSAVAEVNNVLAAEGKEIATFTNLLLGITKVSIYSDSFLSAASFQDTTRVLINAAINGRVDHLRGLKENVIIGRKIPVGTGVAKKDEE